VEDVMGMPIGVDLRDRHAAPELLDRVFAWLRHVDELFSTYRSDSEISRLNRGELGHDNCSPDVREVLAWCERLRIETDGYFDVRAASASKIDPSGLVKGWSIQRVADLLDAAGVTAFAINASGDVVVRGQPQPGTAWRIGIQHPALPNRLAAVLAAENLAIATSGTYQRGDHIFDPHTHRPPSDIVAITVIGRDLATADAYATAAHAMGAAGIRWIARAHDYAGFSIHPDGTTTSTPGFDALRA
jgi:thiamine biosynthesis lipoprotein